MVNTVSEKTFSRSDFLIFSFIALKEVATAKNTISLYVYCACLNNQADKRFTLDVLRFTFRFRFYFLRLRLRLRFTLYVLRLGLRLRFTFYACLNNQADKRLLRSEYCRQKNETIAFGLLL